LKAPALAQSIEWMDPGTARVLECAERLSDAEVLEPSALPGWTRAHVLSHLARNADALVNLLTWARTGVETPMYTSADQRASDIEAGAGRAPAEIRADLRDAVARFDSAVRDLPDAAWSAPIRTRAGRAIDAAEVPWMRVREVWVHVVDLDAGVSFADVPVGLLDALIEDAAASFSARPACPAARLVATDRTTGAAAVWTLGSPTDDAPEVSGATSALAAWLLGRDAGRGLAVAPAGARPELPPWL
jgi:maleylpyruvate isomerase